MTQVETILGTKELLLKLGISPSKLQTLLRDPAFPMPAKLGGKNVYREGAIDRYLDSIFEKAEVQPGAKAFVDLSVDEHRAIMARK